MTSRAKLVTEIIKELEQLSRTGLKGKEEYRKAIGLAEDVLTSAFKIGVSNTKLSSDEIKVIGPLLQKSLPAIGWCVSDIVTDFSGASVSTSKIYRSGLEFIFQDFKHFPAHNSSASSPSPSSEVSPGQVQVVELKKSLEEFKETQEIDEWDDHLRNYTLCPEDPVENLVEGASKVPSSHWWFSL